MAKKDKGASAKTMPMRVLEERGIPYVPRQQGHKQFTAQGVADDLGVPVAWVVKAMIVQRSNGAFALFVIPGDAHLSLKKVAAILGDKGAALAQQRDVERVTGFQVGAVSVLGYRRSDVAAYLDEGVLALERAVISSGRPDLGLELAPQDLLRAMGGRSGDFAS